VIGNKQTGAIYHERNRGDRREAIINDDQERERFLDARAMTVHVRNLKHGPKQSTRTLRPAEQRWFISVKTKVGRGGSAGGSHSTRHATSGSYFVSDAGLVGDGTGVNSSSSTRTGLSGSSRIFGM